MDTFFHAARPGTTATIGEKNFELPILYFRDDLFLLFYTADYNRVKALMPSDKLHPIRLSKGRSLIGVGAFNYVDTSIGPYGEVGMIVPTVHAMTPADDDPSCLDGSPLPRFRNACSALACHND